MEVGIALRIGLYDDLYVTPSRTNMSKFIYTLSQRKKQQIPKGDREKGSRMGKLHFKSERGHRSELPWN